MLSTNPEINPYGIPDPMSQASAQSMAGMFGAKPKWQNALLAAAAGFMARRSPQVAQAILGQIQGQQDAQQKAQMYEKQRQDKFTDWRQQYEYERTNPKPGSGTEYERLLESIGIVPGTDAYKQRVGKYLDAKENPPYFFTDEYGRTMVMPRTVAPQVAPPTVTFTPIDEGGQPGSVPTGGFPVDPLLPR